MIKGDPQKKALRRQKRADKIVVAVETSKQHIQPNKAHVKLSHRRHTGRKLPIHSTSFAVLFFLLVLTGIFLFAIGQQAVVAGPPIVQQGDINVSGIVAGAPPTEPAVILVPTDGTHFTESVIAVSGTCEYGLLVEIMRNNAFAGSQMCSVSGTFSLQVTIIPGTNILIARVSDNLGQYGPDSNPVTVYLDSVTPTPVVPGSGGTTPVSPKALPFLIYTQPVQRGVYPKQLMSIAYEVDGGVSPYAISINWGDGSQPDIVALTAAGDFDKTHIYDRPGQFVVSVSGTDSKQSKAFIQTIVIVNGTIPKTVSTAFGSVACQEDTIVCTIIASTNMLWPILMLALALTLSFWAGEQMVMHRYKKIIKNT
jgi:hypothetical protein